MKKLALAFALVAALASPALAQFPSDKAATGSVAVGQAQAQVDPASGKVAIVAAPAVEQKSGGKLKFKIYAGGVAGDEKDVVRKIRLGQLHAGGFTGVGLGEIAPTLRLLDTPFLFRNTAEVDYVYKTFDKDWRDAFAKGGYVFLGWAEVGFVYAYTNKPIYDLPDLKGVKMWMWEGDPIAETMFKALNISPTPPTDPPVTTPPTDPAVTTPTTPPTDPAVTTPATDPAPTTPDTTPGTEPPSTTPDTDPAGTTPVTVQTGPSVPPGPQGTLPATGPAAATSAIAATAAALILIGLVARRLAR
jgi:hypothetical protein